MTSASGTSSNMDFADTMQRLLSQNWEVFRTHRPAGAYLPTGQLDGDCHRCGGAWPCATVLDAIAADTPNQDSPATEHAACRQATARAWSAFLAAALEDHLEDGTPVLSLVFARNPDLAQRLANLLSAPPTKETTRD